LNCLILTSEFLIRVGLGQTFVAQVRFGQPSLVWVWILFPKNPEFFYFCPSGQKKISSGQFKKYSGQRWVGLLFTAGQKYARAGSLPISNFNLSRNVNFCNNLRLIWKAQFRNPREKVCSSPLFLLTHLISHLVWMRGYVAYL